MKNAKIYKIELPDGKIYIGSTIQTIPQRQASHNRDLKKRPHQKLYSECIKQNITRIKCIWVEDVTINSNCELRAREEYFRKLLNCELNTLRCHRTVEDIIQQNKQYREVNRDVQKQYRVDNADAIRENNKQYYIDNQDKIKQYRKDNKDKLYQHKSELVECELCGSKVTRGVISRHQKSNKCKKLSKLKLDNNEM